MNADLLVVLIRDIARAERNGACGPEYMATAAQFARIALGSDEATETIRRPPEAGEALETNPGALRGHSSEGHEPEIPEELRRQAEEIVKGA